MAGSGPDPPNEQRPGNLDQTLLYARDLARVRAYQRSLSQRLDEAGRFQPAKILLADDEPELRLLLSVTLGLEHYEILEASTGTDALAMAQQQHPDLVLLDVRMPDLNGLEVCRRIKGDAALQHIPVVMISVLAMPSDRESARAAGADCYITKPFSPLQLVEVVQALIGRSEGLIGDRVTQR